jgi:prefoldin subunit 5
LSDQLEASVAAISKELNQLREDLERLTSERDGFRSQLKQMKIKEAQ